MLKFLSFFHFFFNMQSVIGKNFSQLPLAVSGSSRIWWTLTIWGDKGSFRGHKTIWATTPSAQIASVVFLCCLTICSQEKHKMLFSLWKILARFFSFFFFSCMCLLKLEKKKKKAEKEAEKKPRKITELFSPNYFCCKKCHRRLHIPKISAPRAVSECRPKWDEDQA